MSQEGDDSGVLTTIACQGGTLRLDVPPEEWDALRADPRALLWLDLERPSEAELALLEQHFHLHPLAMEDIRKRNQRPKLDRYDGYVHLVLYSLGLDKAQRLCRVEIDMIIGTNYVITVHPAPVPPISALREHGRLRPDILQPHPLGFLVYLLADGLVDGYFPLVDALENRLGELEEQALRGSGQEVLGAIFQLRKDLIAVRNTVEPSRDVFNVLARRDQSFLDASTTIYFTDVYDHLLRISSRLDGLRELAAAALETHLSVQSNQLNLTVERLTAITLVLMIVTLITGFCGMNVQFPGRDTPAGLIYAVVLMVAIGLASLYYSHLKGWL